MKIAISAQEPKPQSVVESRFGRASYFMVFNDDGNSWESINNDQNLNAPQGAGIQSAANVVNEGCTILISGHCGPKAFSALSKAGVSIYSVNSGTVEDALAAYRAGTLEKLASADVEGHW